MKNNKQPVTEKDLLYNFETLRKSIQELETLYGVLPSKISIEAEESKYVSEACFSYQVHSSI